MSEITDTDRIAALAAFLQKEHEIRLHDGTRPNRGCVGLGLNCFGGDLRDAIDIGLLGIEKQAPSNEPSLAAGSPKG